MQNKVELCTDCNKKMINNLEQKRAELLRDVCEGSTYLPDLIVQMVVTIRSITKTLNELEK